MPFFILFLISPLIAQEQTFSPFPSRIKTYISGGEVILTWQDSRDLDGETYLIYRSDQPIDEEFIVNGDPVAEIDNGIMIFTDRPDQGGEYFYAIICRDSHRAYPICLPYRNCTAISVNLMDREVEADRAAEISQLEALTLDGKIAIRFESTSQNREIAVYRSPSPIRVGSDLSKATLLRILERGTQYYLDSPMAGISYYYAVVDYRLAQSNGVNLIYSGNSLQSPVEIPLHDFMEDRFWSAEQRRAPLPEIRLDRFYQDLPQVGIDLPLEQPLPGSLQSKVDSFLNFQPEEELLLEWTRMAPEMGSSEQPLEQELQDILIQLELVGDWSLASSSLLSLLRKSNDNYLDGRIYYYLGQCHYFGGLPEQAYLDFSLSSRQYPLESKPWMDKILENF